MREKWLPIPGWEGLYESSNWGRVRSSHPLRGRILRPAVNNTGYPKVVLHKNGVRKNMPVHQAVMLAFAGARPEGMEIRHLNGCRTDARLENLVYGTRSENAQDRLRHGNHNHANKTHCRHGHPYSGDNLHIETDGRRRCKTCWRENARRKRARLRELAAA